MAKDICVKCGGRRIPIPNWPFGKVHPGCLPDHIQVWPRSEQLAWLAQREAPRPPLRAPSAPRTPRKDQADDHRTPDR